jgi:leucyl/phenylalanyl-tRNA--protein transferase
MAIRNFPPVEFADENGILAIGGDLAPDTILLAYRNGIFPWPHPNYPLLWFAPPKRAVLFFDELHVGRSLRKAQKISPLTFTENQAFPRVMRECAKVKNRGDQKGTWITPQMIKAYESLHLNGHAYSVEAWNGDELVGGFYGVRIGKFIGGESMFYREANASKLALLYFIDRCKEKEINWIDCQTLTHTFQHLGAKEIDRSDFMNLLSRATKGES